MKRISHALRTAGFLTLVLAAVPVLAQQGPPGPGAGRGVRPGRRLLACLKILGLDAGQKSAIQNLLQTERPVLQQLAQTLRSDRATLRTDVQNENPDPAAVGADYLAVEKDLAAMRAEFEKVRASIESQLTADQNAKLEGCLQGARVGVSDAAPALPGGNG
jgi:Spy/CpxP family protein refolding chaperone